MDKTNRTELRRTFLIEALPEPLTRASAHLQIFDNYIPETRLRLRSLRDPATYEWTRILQQRFPAADDQLACIKIAEIYLNESEYAHFQPLEGNEIRKNRYFHEYDRHTFAFDVYLGPLWGLNVARIEFESEEELAQFDTPSFAVFEITNTRFFFGDVLVSKTFEDVRNEVAKLAA